MLPMWTCCRFQCCQLPMRRQGRRDGAGFYHGPGEMTRKMCGIRGRRDILAGAWRGSDPATRRRRNVNRTVSKTYVFFRSGSGESGENHARWNRIREDRSAAGGGSPRPRGAEGQSTEVAKNEVLPATEATEEVSLRRRTRSVLQIAESQPVRQRLDWFRRFGKPHRNEFLVSDICHERTEVAAMDGPEEILPCRRTRRFVSQFVLRFGRARFAVLTPIGEHAFEFRRRRTGMNALGAKANVANLGVERSVVDELRRPPATGARHGILLLPKQTRSERIEAVFEKR